MHLNWKQTVQVWWSFFWRAFVFGVPLGAALSFVAGVYAGISGTPKMAAVYGAMGWLITTIPASMLALRKAITKYLPVLQRVAAAPANAS